MKKDVIVSNNNIIKTNSAILTALLLRYSKANNMRKFNSLL